MSIIFGESFVACIVYILIGKSYLRLFLERVFVIFLSGDSVYAVQALVLYISWELVYIVYICVYSIYIYPNIFL